MSDKVSWKRGNRFYSYQSTAACAFVFSAPDSFMWAWIVYWEGGSKSEVEDSFKRAKKRATEFIDSAESVETHKEKP